MLGNCSTVVGRRGRHGRKLKLKEPESENGHIALRMKSPMKLQATIYGLNFASHFCNLFARLHKARPLCSQGSSFGCESTEPMLACQ
jgi:hypothetical protein